MPLAFAICWLVSLLDRRSAVTGIRSTQAC
jgi:hypothetical protein